MAIHMNSSDKLKITSYKSSTFNESDKVEGEYVVKYNPLTIQHNYSIEYADGQEPGSSGADSKFKLLKPETITFELIFDNTIVAEDEEDKYKVDEDIEKFKEAMLNYSGDIHRPYYVKLSWGRMLFQGQLESLSFTYTAFTMRGVPLKAKANATFRGAVDLKQRLSDENTSSPDLTHIITVKESDTLPMLCQSIYDDPMYYDQIASINGLISFRDLKPGDQLVFPPLQE